MQNPNIATQTPEAYEKKRNEGINAIQNACQAIMAFQISYDQRFSYYANNKDRLIADENIVLELDALLNVFNEDNLSLVREDEEGLKELALNAFNRIFEELCYLEFEYYIVKNNMTHFLGMPEEDREDLKKHLEDVVEFIFGYAADPGKISPEKFKTLIEEDMNHIFLMFKSLFSRTIREDLPKELGPDFAFEFIDKLNSIFFAISPVLQQKQNSSMYIPDPTDADFKPAGPLPPSPISWEDGTNTNSNSNDDLEMQDNAFIPLSSTTQDLDEYFADEHSSPVLQSINLPILSMFQELTLNETGDDNRNNEPSPKRQRLGS